ncbi:hypothetical protein BDN67DRAFT_982753 [Paxillus ammoniavirescens]|nr:hypothetical protein BDN67DRAFT_982753 [Paxillus ammoniavirescens]
MPVYQRRCRLHWKDPPFWARGKLRWAATELLDLELPEDEENPPQSKVVPTPGSDIYSFGEIVLQGGCPTITTPVTNGCCLCAQRERLQSAPMKPWLLSASGHSLNGGRPPSSHVPPTTR